MEPTAIALLALIAVGLIVILAGVYKLIKPDPKFWQIITPFVFGLLMLGLSAFGLRFMTAYGEFLSKVLPLINAPTSETYATAIDAISSGKLSADNAGTAQAIMLENPVPDLESLIERRVVAAQDPHGKDQLKEMLTDLRAKKTLAAQIADSVVQGDKVNTGKLGSLDGSMQGLVAQEIARRPQVVSKLSSVERESVNHFAVPRSARKR
jgi:hypothetical protein